MGGVGSTFPRESAARLRASMLQLEVDPAKPLRVNASESSVERCTARAVLSDSSTPVARADTGGSGVGYDSMWWHPPMYTCSARATSE